MYLLPIELTHTDLRFLEEALAYAEGGLGDEDEMLRRKVAFKIMQRLVSLNSEQGSSIIDGNSWTISLTLSSEDTSFLERTLAFLEGGALDETKRQKLELHFQSILEDLDSGIWATTNKRIFGVECAYCSGWGFVSEDMRLSDSKSGACPVCEGQGFVFLETDRTSILDCRFCEGRGRSPVKENVETIQPCEVCNGLGKIILEELSSHARGDWLWSQLHSSITRVSQSRFANRHYADAVEAALKEVNHAVKQIVLQETSEELDGAKLMNTAFSPNRPVIKLSDLATESGRNRQQGYMQLFAGAIIGVRNPAAHENTELSESEAVHLLFLASLLMTALDDRA